MTWKDTLKQGKEIILATVCEDNSPHAIIVISQGFIEDKLLINACQMHTSLKNIQKNKEVCIVSKDNGEYYRIKGIAEIFSSGKTFEISKQRNEGPDVNHSIIITINEIFDLDNLKIIK